MKYIPSYMCRVSFNQSPYYTKSSARDISFLFSGFKTYWYVLAYPLQAIEIEAPFILPRTLLVLKQECFDVGTSRLSCSCTMVEEKFLLQIVQKVFPYPKSAYFTGIPKFASLLSSRIPFFATGVAALQDLSSHR